MDRDRDDLGLALSRFYRYSSEVSEERGFHRIERFPGCDSKKISMLNCDLCVFFCGVCLNVVL